MRVMKTLRTLREKETRLPIMPLDCSPGIWCSTARRLTRGVLGWDTPGGPDPGIFDTLGGPDRRAGEDHPAGPGGQRAPRHHGAHHQLLHPGPAHPGRPADHLPRLRHGFLLQYPSLFVVHVAASPAPPPPSPEPAGLRPNHTARPLRQRAEQEPNMNDLLDFVLDAHGGLKRWSDVSTLTATLAVGGPFWGQQ